jgi:hypothetical protein
MSGGRPTEGRSTKAFGHEPPDIRYLSINNHRFEIENPFEAPETGANAALPLPWSISRGFAILVVL